MMKEPYQKNSQHEADDNHNTDDYRRKLYLRIRATFVGRLVPQTSVGGVFLHLCPRLVVRHETGLGFHLDCGRN